MVKFHRFKSNIGRRVTVEHFTPDIAMLAYWSTALLFLIMTYQYHFFDGLNLLYYALYFFAYLETLTAIEVVIDREKNSRLTLGKAVNDSLFAKIWLVSI